MKFPVILLLLTSAVSISALAVPQDVRGNAPGKEIALGYDELLDVRGSVPDTTDLSRDLVPDEKQTPLLESSLAALTKLEAKAQVTDFLIFSTGMSTFLTAKKNKYPSSLIWTDNACSKSLDKPLGYNFLHACQRHDFGYRNYKSQERFTDTNRKKVDDNFARDMQVECNRYGIVKKKACEEIAEKYYIAARLLGWL